MDSYEILITHHFYRLILFEVKTTNRKHITFYSSKLKTKINDYFYTMRSHGYRKLYRCLKRIRLLPFYCCNTIFNKSINYSFEIFELLNLVE